MHSHYTNINLASPEEHRALLQRNFSDLEDMFQLHSLSSASAPSVWGPSLTDKLLHNADRLEKVHDWVWEMIQFELEPLAAATLFVQVSWARFQGFEKDALALLIQAQRDAFKTWHETFAKELVQDSERMDVVHGWIWYCIAFELEPVAAALLFVKGCDQEALALLLRVQIETFKAQIGTEIDLKDNSPPEPSQRGDVKAAVTIMKEMREVRKARYRLGTFADAVKNSGLAESLRVITDPHTRREVDFPAIQLSDGKYHWRDFLGVILYNWTPEENRIRPPQSPSSPSKCWCHLPSVDCGTECSCFRDICSTPVGDDGRKSTYSPKVKEGKPGQSAGIKTKTTALGTSCQRTGQAKEHVLSYDDKPGQSAGIKTKTSALGTSSQRRQPKEHVLPYDDIVRVANAPSCPRCDTKPEMERCQRCHAGEYAKAAKRSKKSQLAGKLRPIGSRVPKGGRKGDGYGTYAYHSAQNVQGVRALSLQQTTQTHSWRPSALSLRKWYAKVLQPQPPPRNGATQAVLLASAVSRGTHTTIRRKDIEKASLFDENTAPTSWEGDRRPGSSCSSDSGSGSGSGSDSGSDSDSPIGFRLSRSSRSDSDSDSLNPFRSGLSPSIGPSPATPRDSQPAMQRRELLRKPALIEMEDLPSQLAHDGHASVRNFIKQEGAIVLVAFTNAIAFTRGASPSPRAIVSMSVHRKSDGERQDEMEDPKYRTSFQKLGLFLLELDYRLCTPFLMGPAVHPKLKSSCSLAVIGMAPQGCPGAKLCMELKGEGNYSHRGASRELAPLGIGGIWRLGKLPLEAHLTPPEEKRDLTPEKREKKNGLPHVELKFQGKILPHPEAVETGATGHRRSLRLGKPPLNAHLTPEKCGRLWLPHEHGEREGRVTVKSSPRYVDSSKLGFFVELGNVFGKLTSNGDLGKDEILTRLKWLNGASSKRLLSRR
ncbi:hypothetical protein B0H14DRAFT_2634719 [Mycena olivaceomarginata]|nr:hypothetical protein B0H14DRAFT_2634719 [Mycena olivaceomarginata]